MRTRCAGCGILGCELQFSKIDRICCPILPFERQQAASEISESILQLSFARQRRALLKDTRAGMKMGMSQNVLGSNFVVRRLLHFMRCVCLFGSDQGSI